MFIHTARNAVDVLMRCAGPEEVFPLFGKLTPTVSI